MPEITIVVSDFQMALAEHKYADVNAQFTRTVTNELNRYGTDLSNKVVQRALDAPTSAKKSMDRTIIVQTMFDEEGYENAAAVKTRLDAEALARNASQPAPEDSRIV